MKNKTINIFFTLCFLFGMYSEISAQGKHPSHGICVPPNMPSFTLWQLPGQTRSQMNSYVIQTAGNEIIVIDGGTKGDVGYLREFIRARENHVHAWFFSHPHSDHVDALTTILNNLEGMKLYAIYESLPDDEWLQKHEDSRSLITQRELLAAVAAAKLEVLPLSFGQKIKYQGATFEILGIRNPELTVNTTNNQSAVWRVDIGDKSVLFLGDLGVEGGNKLLASSYRNRLKADYVQMAHHGQRGVNEEFYKGLSRKGKPVLKRKTSKKKLTKAIVQIEDWIKQNLHIRLKDLIAGLNAKLRGHYTYYGITFNYKSIDSYYEQV